MSTADERGDGTIVFEMSVCACVSERVETHMRAMSTKKPRPHLSSCCVILPIGRSSLDSEQDFDATCWKIIVIASAPSRGGWGEERCLFRIGRCVLCFVFFVLGLRVLSPNAWRMVVAVAHDVVVLAVVAVLAVAACWVVVLGEVMSNSKPAGSFLSGRRPPKDWTSGSW